MSDTIDAARKLITDRLSAIGAEADIWEETRWRLVRAGLRPVV